MGASISIQLALHSPRYDWHGTNHWTWPIQPGKAVCCHWPCWRIFPEWIPADFFAGRFRLCSSISWRSGQFQNGMVLRFFTILCNKFVFLAIMHQQLAFRTWPQSWAATKCCGFRAKTINWPKLAQWMFSFIGATNMAVWTWKHLILKFWHFRRWIVDTASKWWLDTAGGYARLSVGTCAGMGRIQGDRAVPNNGWDKGGCCRRTSKNS